MTALAPPAISPASSAAWLAGTRRDTPPEDDQSAGNATIRPITPPQGPNGGGSCNSLDLNKLDPNPTSAGTTDVTYYGYRWFDPVTGRWPSRDPIGVLTSQAFKHSFFFPFRFDGVFSPP
jgi:hypothetical protein